MKLNLFFLMLAVSIFSVSHAQFKVWSYDKYNLKFKMMEDMNVIVNNEDKFQAKSDDYNLDIRPISGEGVTAEGMKEAIIKFAGTSNVFKYGHSNNAGHEQPYFLRDLDHFKGVALDGAANGQAASILLLVDPDNSNMCFLIWIDYRNEFYRETLMIMNSFTPL